MNPVSAVVYSAKGTDVDNVVINGEIIVKGRKILTMDETDILERSGKTVKAVLHKTGIENKSRWETV